MGDAALRTLAGFLSGLLARFLAGFLASFLAGFFAGVLAIFLTAGFLDFFRIAFLDFLGLGFWDLIFFLAMDRTPSRRKGKGVRPRGLTLTRNRMYHHADVEYHLGGRGGQEKTVG
jgi:hypothetical protein